MIDVDDLLAVGCRRTARIGIGVGGEMLDSTTRMLRDRGCEVEVSGFDDPGDLVRALSRGEVDSAIRGTLGSGEVLARLRDEYGLAGMMRTAFLATANGRPFMLAPVGIDEGRDLGERLELARKTCAYVAPAGWKPTIAVLSKGRDEDSGRGDDIRRSLDDGNAIAESLSSGGMDAEHYTILIEKAVLERDLVVAPDGVSGNLIFRSLHFVGAGKAFGAPVVNLPDVFVDTSRAKSDFVEPVLLAAGLSELGCRGGDGP